MRHNCTVTVKIEDGLLCTKYGHTCQFVKKERNDAYCTLHNTRLESHVKGVVSKCEACYACSKITIDEPTYNIDPKMVMKHTVDRYAKYLDELMNAGYPFSIAKKLAKDALMSE